MTVSNQPSYYWLFFEGATQQSNDTTGSLITASQSVGNFITLRLKIEVGQWEMKMVSNNSYTLKVIGENYMFFFNLITVWIFVFVRAMLVLIFLTLCPKWGFGLGLAFIVQFNFIGIWSHVSSMAALSRRLLLCSSMIYVADYQAYQLVPH